MSTDDQQFIEWYATNYVDVLAELDQQRQVVWEKIKSDLLKYVSAGVLLGAAAGLFYQPFWLYPVMGLIAGLVMVYRLNGEQSKAFKNSYKNSVVQPVLEYLDIESNYYPESYVAEDDVFQSGLIQERVNRINGSDYVEGKIGDAEFYYSEIKLEKRKRSSSKNSSDSYSDVYKGLFYVGEYSQVFKGHTVVFPQKSWDLFKQGFGDTKEENLSLIKKTMMDLTMPSWSPGYAKFDESVNEISISDQTLAELFNFYGSDQKEAKRLISDEVWKLINNYIHNDDGSDAVRVKKKLAEKLGQEIKEEESYQSVRLPKVCISISDHKLFIAQPLNADLFEPRIWKANLNIGDMVEYFRFLHFALDLTKMLQSKTLNG
jgi:hypothetical protein